MRRASSRPASSAKATRSACRSGRNFPPLQLGQGHLQLRRRCFAQRLGHRGELDSDRRQRITDVVQHATGHFRDARLVGLLLQPAARLREAPHHAVELAREYSDLIPARHAQAHREVPALSHGRGMLREARDRNENGSAQINHQQQQHPGAERNAGHGSEPQCLFSLGGHIARRGDVKTQDRPPREIAQRRIAVGIGAIRLQLDRGVWNDAAVGRYDWAPVILGSLHLQIDSRLTGQSLHGFRIDETSHHHTAA